MGFGIGDALKVKGAWDKFTRNHPKFPMFLSAVKAKGVPSDTVLGLTVEYPSGEKLATNIKITEQDLELMQELGKLGK